jgi:ketol-acid reductoisomerase
MEYKEEKNTENPRSIVVYREDSANLPHWKNMRVVVVRYYNQGPTQAVNLRDRALP